MTSADDRAHQISKEAKLAIIDAIEDAASGAHTIHLPGWNIEEITAFIAALHHIQISKRITAFTLTENVDAG